MDYLIDTANIEMIKKCIDLLPIKGVTSNPSIIKKEGKIDFFKQLKQIRNIIGINRTLHVQVLAEKSDKIIEEAHKIRNEIDHNVYIKIPVTPEGVKAIQILKSESANITATAIYSKLQGFMAMEAGADYIAPYFNRMENLDIDASATIKVFSNMIDKYKYKTKILAASFKNMYQVNNAFECGAQSATVTPNILFDGFKMPSIKKAVVDFSDDWKANYGDIGICDLK